MLFILTCNSASGLSIACLPLRRALPPAGEADVVEDLATFLCALRLIILVPGITTT